MKLDRHSSLPLYCQLKDYIIEKIESGEYIEEQKVPSELEFCEKLNLSRPTVRQAVGELVLEGKLHIIKGKGTFVSSQSKTKEIRNFNHSTFSVFSSNVISKEEIVGLELIKDIPEKIKNYFKDSSLLRDGLISVRRLLSDETPYAYLESFIPILMFPNLIEDLKAEKPMIDITVNKYPYLPVNGICKIQVASSDSQSSAALDIPRGSGVILTTSVLTSRSKDVCEIVFAYLRADVCKLVIS